MRRLRRRHSQSHGLVTNSQTTYLDDASGSKPTISRWYCTTVDDETPGSPSRILRFRLRMARYNYTVEHVPGKLLYSADALSRAPSKGNDSSDELQYDAESYIASVISNLPSTPDRLEMYRQAQEKDLITRQVIQWCQSV